MDRSCETNRHLRRQYGITLVEKRAMYDGQRGLCGLCGEPMEFREARLDHDHATGQLRALLHKRCNLIVGNVESPLGKRAVQYLAEHVANAATARFAEPDYRDLRKKLVVWRSS